MVANGYTLRCPTRANDSNPRLCPSTVSMWWLRANRRLPSITKATCCGIGPCLRDPMRSSRNCLTVHATGGEDANHLCMRESWSDPMVNIVEVRVLGFTKYFGGAGHCSEGWINYVKNVKSAAIQQGNKSVMSRATWHLSSAVNGKLLRNRSEAQ